VLHYYTSQDDLVIGTDVANRNQAETEHLIGFFVNQLVLRIDLSGNPGLLELLHRARQISLAAHAHQDLPFDRLVEVLNPRRDLHHTPLFQVKLLLQNGVVASEFPFANLVAKPINLYQGTPEFDLILNISESNPGLFVRLEYRKDLFNAASMAQFLRHFEK